VPKHLEGAKAAASSSASGAAHAACFTMSFVRMLETANFVPEQVDSKSDVIIEKEGDGFSISSVHLTVLLSGIPSR
jgi:organic hydroperoxide reductase OsmC/OhrA